MKKMIKFLKIGRRYFFLLFLGLILLFLCGMRINKIGGTLGQATGSQLGKFVGSFEALGDYRMAYAEGKEQGLSAEDTTVEVANKIKEAEELEVLVASVKLKDMHKIGEDYAALYLLKGEAIFTVDFGEAEITEEEDKINIVFPEPEVTVDWSQSDVNKIAEYQKKFFSGDSKDGFDAYLNSMKMVAEEAKTSLANYDSLMDMAKKTACEQVEDLVDSVTIEKKKVNVSFKGAE